MQFVTLTYTIIMKGCIMLKIKIKVNDAIQAPKNKTHRFPCRLSGNNIYIKIVPTIKAQNCTSDNIQIK